jgi:nitroreductase
MQNNSIEVKNRRSARRFTDRLLSPDQVEMILRAALMAPSSNHRNPWQFVVVEDKKMLAKLASCKENGSAFISGCVLAIVVSANFMESDTWVEDAAIAATYMQLQAEDLGLGSCWCQIHERNTDDNLDAEQYVRNLLDMPYQLGVLCIIGFGYRADALKPHDEAQLQWEKVHLDKFTMPNNAKEGEA